MKKAIIVVDLGFGDGGKGTIIDFLSRQLDSPLIVRYNGGPQCAHNVVLPNGTHHTFAQFGSGMFVPSVRTYLSENMIVNPITLLNENAGLSKHGVSDGLRRVIVNENCLVSTPFHSAANRIRELSRGKDRHGSCGMGIGEVASSALSNPEHLKIKDLRDMKILSEKLKLLQSEMLSKIESLGEIRCSEDDLLTYKYEMEILKNTDILRICMSHYKIFTDSVAIDNGDILDSDLNGSCDVIFEGAQGVLLDEKYGFHPHTTWSDTTTKNAHSIIEKYPGFNVKTLGIIRTYATRHGAGPFPSASDAIKDTGDTYNIPNQWQKSMRSGYLDFVLLRYALAVLGDVDSLAVTHLDYVWRNSFSFTNSYSSGEDDLIRLSEYFDLFSTGLVKDIKVVGNPSLERQEAISNILSKCAATVTPGVDPNAIKDIQEHLKTEVRLVSYGKTFLDKKFIK